MRESFQNWFNRAITLSIDSYWTDEFFWGIRSLTELCFGKKRSWITRYFPCSDLGTTPKGDEIKCWKGGEEKGPAMRFLVMPSNIKSDMTEGKLTVILWFFEIDDNWEPA